ncbi:hypothetical protein DWZ82_03325 [Butyricicoccus sp. AF35-5AC]|nr:hypothetical protein DWZ82_03325 [Butyricicoccus sp. AF35-5AC]
MPHECGEKNRILKKRITPHECGERRMYSPTVISLRDREITFARGEQLFYIIYLILAKMSSINCGIFEKYFI